VGKGIKNTLADNIKNGEGYFNTVAGTGWKKIEIGGSGRSFPRFRTGPGFPGLSMGVDLPRMKRKNRLFSGVSMRVLVIGGTGFIGSFVVKALVEGGHTVAVFHRGLKKPEQAADVREMRGERGLLATYRADFRDFAPAVVIDMFPYVEEDARTLVEAFRGLAGRVVAISSQDVYRAYGRLIGVEPGPPDPVPLLEESPLREKRFPYRGPAPRAAEDPQRWMDDYDKIPVEQTVLSQPELPGTVLRLPAVYGPGDPQHRIYPYLKRMDDQRPAILVGRNVANWQWTRGYVEDVAAAIALAAVSEQAAGQIYNVGEAEALTEVDWVRAIGRTASWDGAIKIISTEKMPDGLRFDGDTRQNLLVDSGKIRRALGYRERFDRLEALRRTVAWERSHAPEKFPPGLLDYAADDKALADESAEKE
jgi:nucleoside-diphosphate-sugar epimerase